MRGAPWKWRGETINGRFLQWATQDLEGGCRVISVQTMDESHELRFPPEDNLPAKEMVHISCVPRSFPFIKPCLPSLRDHPPQASDWIHEVKFDGWRCQLHKCGGAVRLYSKRGNDLGFRFPVLVQAVWRLPIDNVDS